MNNFFTDNENELIYLGHSELFFKKAYIDNKKCSTLDLSNKKACLYFLSLKENKILKTDILIREKNKSFFKFLPSKSTKNWLPNEFYYETNINDFKSKKTGIHNKTHYSSIERINDNNLNYLILKRKEYSLKKSIYKYDDILTIDDVQEDVFYDVFFMNEKESIFILNDKVDFILNEKDILFYLKNKKENVYKNKLKKELYSFYFKVNYIFYENKIFLLKNKNEIKKFNEKYHEKGNEQKQFFKIFNLNYLSDYIDLENLNEYNIGNTGYDIDFRYLFNESDIFKEYIYDTFNVFNSIKEKAKTLNELIYFHKKPLFENLSFQFLNDDVLYSYYINNLLTNSSYEDYVKKEPYYNFYYKSDYYDTLFKDISYKDIQSKIPIFSKKNNELLKDKFIFLEADEFYELERNKALENNTYFLNTFSPIIMYLFKNKDNLQKFIQKHPTVYINKYIDELLNEFSVEISLYYIDKKDYFDFNVHEIIKNSNKMTRKEALKKALKITNNMKYDEKKENFYFKSLNINDIHDMFIKVFDNSNRFEELITDYFYKDFNINNFNINTFYDNVSNHLYDIIRTFYKLDYIYESKKYKKYMENHFKYFYEKKYKTFEEFEKELYVLDAFLNKEYLEQTLPVNNYVLPFSENYYFKEPTDGFELKLVGEKMSHCVFTYFDSLRKKDSKQSIVILYEKETNKPLVCLEINKDKLTNQYKLIQAKCKFNKIVSKELTYKNLVLDFCVKNNINTINCFDLK